MKAPSDKEVTELARELARLSSSAQSSVYRMSWWNTRLMEWSMRRPAFKSRLFRFVDVFPATVGNKDVLRHVDEYLTGEGVPSTLQKAIGLAKRMPFGAAITASQARSNIARMADQFILGTNTDEAVRGATKLWSRGSATTIDLLGEKVVRDSEADNYAARVMELVTALAAAAPAWKANPLLDSDDLGAVPRSSVSIKPSALSARYKPLTADDGISEAKNRLRPILRVARDREVLVWFDMEHFEVKDLTLRLFRELMSEPEFATLPAGVVIQAYLKEAHLDLADLIAWSGARSQPAFVRLVKGAYWDTETIIGHAHDWPVPVFERKVESDAAYERCTRLLLDHHGAVRAAFASHNLRSLAYAVAYARKEGLPDNAYEIQMLYGMAEPMHEAVKRMNLRLRVYAPVGELVPGMAYLVRRLLENTSNESFVRLRFAEGRELDELVAPPKVDRLPDVERLAARAATDPKDPADYHPDPPAQWHRYEVRDAMTQAIAATDTAQSRSGAPYVHARIDGHTVATDATIESVNPTHPSVVVARSASCTAEHVEAAMQSAAKAWHGWARTPAAERSAVLFRAGDWMRRRRFELAALQVHEAGKPWADADGDVCEAIDFCEYYGREMLRIDAGGVVQSPPGESNSLHYEARGVGAVIAPWNFPLAIPTGMVTAALVTGNAVLFKPSEQTPAIAEKLVEALEAAGLPKGVLQFLPGRGEDVGAAMVAHKDTSFIAFTGSKEVGLSIIESAAKHRPGQRHIKKVIAELGGKNPMIVDSDADLDQAVPAIMYSAFGFSGQKCSALSRLIVLDAVKDQLLERLQGAMGALHVGDPRHMSTEVGPVIDAEAQQRIRGVVDGAFMWGDVLASRTDIPAEGFFVPPTIVADVKPDSPLAREEIFGPVLSTFSARDIDDALSIANNSEYALTAGLFSRSPSVIDRVTREIRGGNIYVNRTTTGAVVGRQPFGGFGMSGIGTKQGGPDYLLQLMEPRTVTENTIRQGFAELS